MRYHCDSDDNLGVVFDMTSLPVITCQHSPNHLQVCSLVSYLLLLLYLDLEMCACHWSKSRHVMYTKSQ